MASSDMFLYWGSGSPPCWTVMIVLEEKALQGYGQKILSFGSKEHKSEEITKINPRGQLPTFRHGDIVINESMAIVEYLESVFAKQGTSLMPAEPAAKARVLQKMHEALAMANNISPAYKYLMTTKKEEQDEEKIKSFKEAFEKEMTLWETYFAKQPEGSYAAGEFSLADAALLPRIIFPYRLGLPAARFPHIHAYVERMKARASVQASWPPHWKDSPAGLTILANF